VLTYLNDNIDVSCGRNRLVPELKRSRIYRLINQWGYFKLLKGIKKRDVTSDKKIVNFASLLASIEVSKRKATVPFCIHHTNSAVLLISERWWITARHSWLYGILHRRITHLPVCFTTSRCCAVRHAIIRYPCCPRLL
jgi:hypothetical protein